MWPFKKNNETPLNSGEYEQLAKKFVSLSTKVEELEGKFKVLQTNYDNLRGNFNRKLSGLKEEEKVTPKEEEEETKSINNPMFIPYNGSFS
jgi:uncharacterized coiled-coil DUF342 family protein